MHLKDCAAYNPEQIQRQTPRPRCKAQQQHLATARATSHRRSLQTVPTAGLFWVKVIGSTAAPQRFVPWRFVGPLSTRVALFLESGVQSGLAMGQTGQNPGLGLSHGPGRAVSQDGAESPPPPPPPPPPKVRGDGTGGGGRRGSRGAAAGSPETPAGPGQRAGGCMSRAGLRRPRRK